MFTSNNQFWDDAVVRNTAALKGVVAQLLALLAAYGGIEARALPRLVHSALIRGLRPAESALRRLIVIVARNVKVPDASLKAKQSSSSSNEGVFKNRGSGVSRPAFQLFDPRKRFGQRRIIYASLVPHVSFIAPDPPFSPLAVRPPEPQRWADSTPDPELGRDIGARCICRRLEALSSALEDVPRQAKRLVRLQALRERRKIVIYPLRPGRPPGHRSIPREGVDFILAECHRFAQGVLAEQKDPPPNTS